MYDSFLEGDDKLSPFKIEKPKSLYQALLVEKYQVDVSRWETLLIRNGIYPSYSDYDIRELLSKIREINTCTNLNSPIEVWVVKNGDIRVKVYDKLV